MTEKDIKLLTDLAKKKMKEKRTKEEAHALLVSAGVVAGADNYAKNYPNLSRLEKK